MTPNVEDLSHLTYLRGRVAMAAILRGLGVRPGDDVAVQAFTCLAVPEAVLAVRARPVWVDVAPGALTMDPVDLAAKLTGRTKAIVVQHTFGIPADLDALMRVAAERQLPVVEDCAHTVASAYGGRTVGTIGAASFFSYEASKPIFVGIGGSALVCDPELRRAVENDYAALVGPSMLTQAQVFAMYLAHRLVYRPFAYWTVRAIFRRMVALGVIKGNYNVVDASLEPSDDFRRTMGGIQHRLLRRALANLAAQTAHRRWVADQYRSQIAAAHARHPQVPVAGDPVYGRYPMLTTRKADLLRLAPTMHVELADFYATPVHPLSGAALDAVGYRVGSCPRAEALPTQVVSLPTARQVDPAHISRAARLFASI